MNLEHCFVLFPICAAAGIAQDHSLNPNGTDLISNFIDGKMTEDKVTGSFSDQKSSAAGAAIHPRHGLNGRHRYGNHKRSASLTF